MPVFGSHLSIAGGYYKAVEAAAKLGLDAVQLFTKNNNQWQGKPLTEEDVQRFRQALASHSIGHPISHASYLINLASPDSVLRQKSIDAMVVEIQRADRLGIPYVIFHPGAFTTSSEGEGLRAIVESLNEIHSRTKGCQTYPLLENTAGQGSNLGWRFEHLQQIIEQAEHPERLGVCLDTCHAFAAGYPMASPEDYRETVTAMENSFGIHRIKAIHLNDSKKPLGSRRDRHEHIGEGEMGLEPFRNLLNDPRFAAIPMYLETEKGQRDGIELDAINLRTLKSLLRKSRTS
jgi:deoxyribonuclease-4